MAEETKFQIVDLSELEYRLIINALKIWRGDWEEFKITDIWYRELDTLLEKLGYKEKGWPETNKKEIKYR